MGKRKEPAGKEGAAEGAAAAEDAPKKATAKRGPKGAAGAGADEAGEPPKKAARKTPAKKADATAPGEPHTGADGWTIHPPSLIYKVGDVKPSSKVAAFDLDGTLVEVKSSMQFPRDEHDWRFFNKKVPKVVREWHDKGYKIVIFSNQNGIKSALEGKMADKVKKRVDLIAEKLEVPLQAFLATGKDEFRKPEPGMWRLFVDHHNGGKAPDVKASFFCGDAAGRPGDFADSDKGFAAAAGLPFKTPEDMFGETEVKKSVPAPGDASTSENHNAELSDAFQRLSELMSREGANPFGVRAMANVASILARLPNKVTSSKDVKSVKGIGKASLEKIDEFLSTGTLKALEEGGEGKKKAEANKAATEVSKEAALKFL